MGAKQIPLPESKQKTITINAPIAYCRDKVDVKNYNRGGSYENGKVVGLKATFYTTHYIQYQYRILLDRRSKNGNLLFLTVGDDAIVKLG